MSDELSAALAQAELLPAPSGSFVLFTNTDIYRLYGRWPANLEEVNILTRIKDILNAMKTIKARLNHEVKITVLEGYASDSPPQNNIPAYISSYRDCQSSALTMDEINFLSQLKTLHTCFNQQNSRLQYPFIMSVTFPEARPTTLTADGRRFYNPLN